MMEVGDENTWFTECLRMDESFGFVIKSLRSIRSKAEILINVANFSTSLSNWYRGIRFYCLGEDIFTDIHNLAWF